MSDLESDIQGEGYQASCAKSFSDYFEENGIAGAIVAPTPQSLEPEKEIRRALADSRADLILTIDPVGTTMSHDLADYARIEIDSSLLDVSEGRRVWRAQVLVSPDTGVYWQGDKEKTCTTVITDIFAQLRADGFDFRFGRESGNTGEESI